jgi:hypothetical protein
VDRGTSIAVRPPDRCSECTLLGEGSPKPGSESEGRQLDFTPGTPPKARADLGHYVSHELRECVGIGETVCESAITCALLDDKIWDPAGHRAKPAVQLEDRCVARHSGFGSHSLGCCCCYNVIAGPRVFLMSDRSARECCSFEPC